MYSDETLREIMRAEEGGGASEEYLSVLEQLGAYHLRQEFGAQFNPTGNAIVQSVNPFQTYETFVENKEFDDLIEANLLVSRKVMGGLPELSVEDIAAKMLAAFERLMASLDNNIKNLEGFFPDAGEVLTSYLNSLGGVSASAIDEYKKTLSELTENLTTNIKLDDTSSSALSRYREGLKLNPKNLNNIPPPNVVEQVWEVISADMEVAKSGVTINQFFGVDVPNPIYSFRKSFLSEQAGNVYFHLNLAGYHPDRRLHKRREFSSSFSDMQHVSLATHCDYLISSDERLIKKAAATYEFIGAETQAVLIPPMKSDIG